LGWCYLIRIKEGEKGMINRNQDSENKSTGVLMSILVGYLAGASVMLLLAPQSGVKSRLLINEKGIELRDEVTGILEAGMAQAWLAKNKVTRDARRKAKEILRHSQANIVEQLESVSKAVQAWKTAALDSHH
jgi:gas vesicle protein